MPKADRCAQLKKESQATRKRLVTEMRQSEKEQEKLAKEMAKLEEERLAAERAKARTVGPSRFERTMQAGKGSSTFNKAGTVVVQQEASDDEDEYGADEDEVNPSSDLVRTSSGAQPKKESATSKKKAAAEQNRKDMAFLEAEKKAAMRNRIVARLLRLFVVGFLIDAYREKEQRPSKDVSKVKKKVSKASDDSSGWSLSSLWDKANIFTGPVLMMIFTVFLGFLVIAGEDFDPDAMQASGVNLYEVLGVASDADVLAIRKAYKNLAISWHPDKNPGCEACAARFAKIGEAYEILNNADKKKAYDQRRAPEGTLESVASVDLTVDDFEFQVLRSNDVWFVEIYESTDGASKSFHPLWEDVAQKHDQLARFGRIDAQRHRRALRFLPQRVLLFPVVFRFARGRAPELFQPDFGMEERSSAPLARFVQENLPLAPVLASPSDVTAWWTAKTDRPRILVAGPVAQQKNARGGFSAEFLQVQRSAFLWAEFLDIAFCEQSAAEAALSADVMPKGTFTTGKSGKGTAWFTALQRRSGALGEKRTSGSIKKLPSQLEELIPKAVVDVAPQLTVRNYQQLCGAHHASRTYCLLLVDATDDRVAAALTELNDSKQSYAQEVSDMGSNDASEEGTEEAFHIQPVRISTSSSRLPWLPVGAGAGFGAVWAETQQAPAFLFEAETRRLGAVRTPSFRELFQQIAYDDLKFQALSEQVSFTRALPDPEVPLARELQHALSTPVGAIGAFVLAACAFAVIPELSVVTSGAFAAAVASLLLVAWPLAARRFVGFFWCTVSSSSFQCQVGA